jgi:hypothetical protein
MRLLCYTLRRPNYWAHQDRSSPLGCGRSTLPHGFSLPSPASNKEQQIDPISR